MPARLAVAELPMQEAVRDRAAVTTPMQAADPTVEAALMLAVRRTRSASTSTDRTARSGPWPLIRPGSPARRRAARTSPTAATWCSPRRPDRTPSSARGRAASAPARKPTCTVHLTRDAQVTAVFQFRPQDECAGLGPGPVGDPTGSAEIQPAQFESCQTGPPNGDGIVPLGTMRGPAVVEDTSWTFFDPQGSRRRAFRDFNVTVAERASGFMLSRTQE